MSTILHMVDIVNYLIKVYDMPNSTSLDSVFHLVHMLKRQLHERIEQLDLAITPMHVRVIKIIDRKAPCTAMDIAHYLNRDKAQVARLLNTLIEQNLITKEPNPDDKRSQCLLTTESGENIVKKIAMIDAQIFEQMANDLSLQDQKDFQRIASKMAINLGPKGS